MAIILRFPRPSRLITKVAAVVGEGPGAGRRRRSRASLSAPIDSGPSIASTPSFFGTHRSTRYLAATIPTTTCLPTNCHPPRPNFLREMAMLDRFLPLSTFSYPTSLRIPSDFPRQIPKIADECCSTQLIDGDGEFNVQGIDNFMNTVKLAECGLSYAVVAIMGPQSSGKSTLLNHLFYTNIKEMDAYSGRKIYELSQATKGILLARCVGIEPCTIVMDLEGSDGRERGEDDTTFEKQSALFALAVLDIVLINMWCHDIGREQAANKPILKTVFQVMMRLFSPHKTTLLFVIREKTKTPMENLEPILREDIQKIWDDVPKPQAHKETHLCEFFNVEVASLNSYEEKEEKFKEQPNAVRVWVDIVKVKDAAIWRPSSEIECMEDAISTTIAWPEDNVVVF